MATATPDLATKLREYATRERSIAQGIADSSLKTPKAASPEVKQKALQHSSYYRARQNSMDDILRLLNDLAPASRVQS